MQVKTLENGILDINHSDVLYIYVDRSPDYTPVRVVNLTPEFCAKNNLQGNSVKTTMTYIELLHGFVLDFAESQKLSDIPGDVKKVGSFFTAAKADFAATRDWIKNLFH